jgi:hypothetical protein
MPKYLAEFWLVAMQARKTFVALEAPHADTPFARPPFNDLQSYTRSTAGGIIARTRESHVPTLSGSPRFLHSIGQ